MRVFKSVTWYACFSVPALLSSAAPTVARAQNTAESRPDLVEEFKRDLERERVAIRAAEVKAEQNRQREAEAKRNGERAQREERDRLKQERQQEQQERQDRAERLKIAFERLHDEATARQAEATKQQQLADRAAEERQKKIANEKSAVKKRELLDLEAAEAQRQQAEVIKDGAHKSFKKAVDTAQKHRTIRPQGGVLRIATLFDGLYDVAGNVDKGNAAANLIQELRTHMEQNQNEFDGIMKVKAEAERLRRTTGRLSPEQIQFLNHQEKRRIEILVEKPMIKNIFDKYKRDF